MKKEFSYKMTLVGIIGLLLTLGMMFITSCQKDISNDLELIQENEPTFTEEMYKQHATSYDNNDLLALLGQYNTNTPNIVPAFNNFYNDVGGGGTYVGNLTLVEGERFFNPANQMVIDTTGYTFDWYVNDVLQCSETNPQFWDLDNNLDCDGVFELQLVVTTPTGAVFSRTQWAYVNYNSPELNLPTCDCLECPTQFNVFYTFWPDVDPYFYQTQCTSWDLNCDQIVNINDLLILLGGY